jgi:hypothetical protein
LVDNKLESTVRLGNATEGTQPEYLTFKPNYTKVEGEFPPQFAKEKWQ